jgi:putative sugar O-methyltransferase
VNSVSKTTAGTVSKALADDPALLAMMIEDAERSGPLWNATAYWRGYAKRIKMELARSGLANLRTNQRLLKGFALGGIPEPEMPQAGWKRAAWRLLQAGPGVRQMLAEHRRVRGALHARHCETSQQHARMAMDEIARAFPELRPPAGIANGGADDAFLWRDSTIVPQFTMYVARTADFYAKVDSKDVTSILEIGPGLGLSSLAHMALNPHLRLIVNVDIAPVLYLSTQFLKSIDGVEVIDYRALRGADRIALKAPTEGVRIYQAASTQMPRLDGTIDALFNAFSFQEMETDVCRGYAAEALRMVRGGVMLHGWIAGHKAGAGGQKAPVTLAFLESLFRDAFPKVAQIDGFWPRFYDGDPALTRLMTK